MTLGARRSGLIFSKGLKSGIKHITVRAYFFTIILQFTSQVTVSPPRPQTLPFGGREHPHSASDIFLHFQRLQNACGRSLCQLFPSFRTLLVTAFLFISEHTNWAIPSI